MFLVQLGDLIPAAGPGPSLGSMPSGMPSRWHLYRMPEPPQQTLLDLKEGRLYFEVLRTPHRVSDSESSSPVVKPHLHPLFLMTLFFWSLSSALSTFEFMRLLCNKNICKMSVEHGSDSDWLTSFEEDSLCFVMSDVALPKKEGNVF